MSNIKLIVCDIDDTLIPRGKDDISDNLKMAFKQLKEKNIKLLVATGRHYKFLQPKSQFIRWFLNPVLIPFQGSRSRN